VPIEKPFAGLSVHRDWWPAIESALAAIGARPVAAYTSSSAELSAGSSGSLLIATDVGLVEMALRSGPDGEREVVADLTTWNDVRDVEVRVRVVMFVDPIITLSIQLPRIREETTEATERNLGAFTAAVLAAVERHR
jgi:hypothetical protein